jgi:hypothetical protein
VELPACHVDPTHDARRWTRSFAALLAALGCHACAPAAVSSERVVDGIPAGLGIVVVESDWTSGAAEVVEPVTHVAPPPNSGLGIDPDPLLRRLVDPAGREHVFLLGRRTGRISELDRAGKLLRSFFVGDDGDFAGAPNPTDLAYAPDGNLWVTRWAKSTLLVLGPDGARVGAVDLSKLADADGRPEMSAIAIVEGIAYVALERLQADGSGSLVPTAYSSIAAVDTRRTAGAPTEYVRLPPGALNPMMPFRRRQDGPATELWIHCLGAPQAVPPVPGALVKLELTKGTATTVLDGRPSGTFFYGYDIVDAHTGWVVVASLANADNPTTLVPFDPSTGELKPAWYRRDSYQLSDVHVSGGRLFLVDRQSQEQAVVIFDTTDGSIVNRFATRLPAVEMVLLRQP